MPKTDVEIKVTVKYSSDEEYQNIVSKVESSIRDMPEVSRVDVGIGYPSEDDDEEEE